MADPIIPPDQQPPVPPQPQQSWLQQYGPTLGALALGYLRGAGSPRLQGGYNAAATGLGTALDAYSGLSQMAQQQQAAQQQAAARAQLAPEVQHLAAANLPKEIMPYATAGMANQGIVNTIDQALSGDLPPDQRQVYTYWKGIAQHSPVALDPTKFMPKLAAGRMPTTAEGIAIQQAMQKGQDPLAAAEAVRQKEADISLARGKELASYEEGLRRSRPEKPGATKPEKPLQLKDWQARLAAARARGEDDPEAERAITELRKIGESDQKRIDDSYKTSRKEILDVQKPITDLDMRYQRLIATVNERTRQADALVAPELLTVMAGGRGTGLRMSEAEIARIVGGRSKWDTLRSNLNAWKDAADRGEGVSIPDAQRQEISQLLNAIGPQIKARNEIIAKASSALRGSKDVDEHRRIVSDMQDELNQLNVSGGAGGSGVSGVTLPEGFTLTPVQ